MNIALLAHDNKIELMVQFCLAYCGILEAHELCAPTTTGKLVSDATGLTVTLYLPRAKGGCQQIGARIACNEIDLVLFFCDTSGREDTKDIDSIARLCDQHSIPFASNVATAEVLIQGLKYGDLDWREVAQSRKPRLAL